MNPDDAFVLVAGANGRTGREAMALLLDAGVRVRAVTSSPENVETLELQGADEVVVADLLDLGDAHRAVGGGADRDPVTAVVCAVGDSPSIRTVRATLVDGEGVENLVDAAKTVGVERFALVSSLGVGDSAEALPASLRAFFDLFGILEAKERGEDALRESGVPYTVIRPGGLRSGPATEDVVVGEGGDTVSGAIPRRDVARLLVASLFTPDAAGRTFEVVARDDLRGNPSGVVEVDWQLPELVVEKRR
ncbi:SDR family oxidoreductase [Halomarina rubra]|uniref:SDR family oxidoreductase n=1 Tax=Halomarina rubra TaxID=2071873 RepID=A0ABD6B003_9EURY|nr:SDR family oxidoreductase [Halomarina rubra]